MPQSIDITTGVTGSLATPLTGALRAKTYGPTTLPQWDALRSSCWCGCGVCGGTGQPSVPSPPELTEVQRTERLGIAFGIVYGSFLNAQQMISDDTLADSTRQALAAAMQEILDRVDPILNQILGRSIQTNLGSRAFVRAEVEDESP